MSTLNFIALSIMSLILWGCGDKETNNLDVETYIESLRQGTYDSMELPEFTAEDIPALLAYSNETELIENYPNNPISSYILNECQLGIYVLWTIESIRAVAIESEYLIGRFPSLNPIIKLKVDPYDVDNNVETMLLVSTAYNEWWNNSNDTPFSQFKFIDPLETTNFKWY